MVCAVVLFPILIGYAFCINFQVGIPFLITAIVAIYFRYFLANQGMLFVVFAGVVFADDVTKLQITAKDTALAGNGSPHC